MAKDLKGGVPKQFATLSTPDMAAMYAPPSTMSVGAWWGAGEGHGGSVLVTQSIIPPRMQVAQVNCSPQDGQRTGVPR